MALQQQNWHLLNPMTDSSWAAETKTLKQQNLHATMLLGMSFELLSLHLLGSRKRWICLVLIASVRGTSQPLAKLSKLPSAQLTMLSWLRMIIGKQSPLGCIFCDAQLVTPFLATVWYTIFQRQGVGEGVLYQLVHKSYVVERSRSQTFAPPLS